MAKHTTLSDLNAFLEDKGRLEEKKVETKEEYIQEEPKKIVETKPIGTKAGIKKQTSGFTVEDVAFVINELAKEKGTSYAEICLEIFEKGSEITPVLKGGGVVTTWFSAHKTALNVIKNSIKNRRSK